MSLKPQFASPSYSLLAKAAEITGWNDGELAQLAGIPRSTVQAYRTGRCIEYLDASSINALMAAVRLYRDQVVAMVDEMECFT